MKKILVLAVLLAAGTAFGASYQKEGIASAPSSGYSVAGFKGNSFTNFQVAFESALISGDAKIQARVGGTWTDFDPSNGSPDDAHRVIRGGLLISDLPSAASVFWPSAVDSMRVLVKPDSAVDTTVVAW